MAEVQQGNFLGVVDKRRVPGQSTINLATPANYASVSAMRTRLIAINPTYYTTARLNAMTVNDMVYALRLADDAAGF
jgi:hypothetical protein